MNNKKQGVLGISMQEQLKTALIFQQLGEKFIKKSHFKALLCQE